MVVLDLFAEVKPIWITSKQFYGVPYIWKVLCFSKCWFSTYINFLQCMLHILLGNIEMYGILDAIALGPIEARTSENSTMVGVGMSMEGIEQNLLFMIDVEMAFHHKPKMSRSGLTYMQQGDMEGLFQHYKMPGRYYIILYIIAQMVSIKLTILSVHYKR
ncbi:unnamed protein product [Musa acuminata subsp. burmannicoides]